MTTSIEVGILTPTRIRPVSSGEAFLRILAKYYTPDHFSSYEPVRTVFDLQNPSKALAAWSSGFLWSRRQSRLKGQVVFGRDGFHDGIYVSMNPKPFNFEETISFISEVEHAFAIDIAYIHPRRRSDSDEIEKYKCYTMPFSQGMSSRHLQEGLPGLTWGTFFGKPYTAIFGDRLADVPVYTKRTIRNCTYLQLTESIKDVDTNREEYEAAQAAAKEHLDSNVFRVLGRRGPYRIPDFNLS